MQRNQNASISPKYDGSEAARDPTIQTNKQTQINARWPPPPSPLPTLTRGANNTASAPPTGTHHTNKAS
ncbi:hypothetical protein E2C01_095056 [Portunus trituberculatus]|uniref:Uncharacterized protein n=1 Tax=Portunus trituberculatus TaxID=210409 RepID=A0A5B7JXU3_PORTR|nr:hypothetical protein [Portunus trituberculatus]